VVLRPGVRLEERELSEFCRRRLASFKAPEVFHFVDALPKTANGKLRRVELRHRV
jgi:acyl-coenzyme A synthetase/AMP-(fatty) acid ligase